jgi:hypothetical protein
MASQPASRNADRLTADMRDPGICPAVPGGCLRDALLPLRPDATLTLDPASRLVDGTVYGARGRTGKSIATAPHTAQHRPTHPVCAVTTGRHCAWEAQLLPESGHLRLPYWTIQRSQQPPAVYRRSGELRHGQEEHAVGPVRSHDTRDPIPPKSFSCGGVRSAPRTHLLRRGPWVGACLMRPARRSQPMRLGATSTDCAMLTDIRRTLTYTQVPVREGECRRD